MNAPAVQYVKTSDGYSIAYTVHGEGPLLVFLPLGFSHAQVVWTGSSATPLLQTLSRRFRVLYYDGRGQGLSKRGLPLDTSIESLTLDLRAVLDMAGPEKPVLMADNNMAHLAARFVVQNPGRVRALVFMHCPVSLLEQIKWVGSHARQNWEYFLASNSGLAAPADASEVERLRRRVEGLQARTTQEDFLRICDIFAASDISETLPKLDVPTLVLHIPTHGWVTQEESAATAALLPNGRLVVVSGATFFGEPNEIAATVDAFLAETAMKAPAPVSPASILSAREIEVLRLVAAGKSNQQIADELVISLNTVNRHVSNVYAKTGAANRAEAVSYAHRHGLAG